jgi:hypothetical protein
MIDRRKLIAGLLGPTVLSGSALAQQLGFYGFSGSVGNSTAPTLVLNFLSGTLDPRINFSRASSATYFDNTGTLHTASTNVPRFDYNPNTLTPMGLLIEEQRTNLCLQSGALQTSPWGSWATGTGVPAPTVTGNNAIAPDGTTTAARIAYPAVSGAGAESVVNQPITVSTVVYAFSLYLKGAVGGEVVYIMASPDGVTYYRTSCTLTTSWQRFSFVTSALTPSVWFFQIGVDLRDGSQTSKPAQTIYAWGAQLEAGAFPTSYIPTTSAAATRAVDVATMPVGAWFNASAGSWFAQFIVEVINTGADLRIIAPSVGALTPIYSQASGSGLASYDGSFVKAGNTVTFGTINKAASTWANNLGSVCLNAGTVVTGAQTTGFGVFSGNSVQLMAQAGGINIQSGWLQNVQYWPRALSSAELQAVTT